MKLQTGSFQECEESLSSVLSALMSACLIYSYEQKTQQQPTFEQNKFFVLIEHANYVRKYGLVGEA